MKILAAVDRSDYAERVIDMTRRLAKAQKAKVLLMHAAPREPDVFGKQLVRKVITDDVPEELRDRRELLDRSAARLKRSKISCETLLVRGKPGASILSEAERWGADLIIIGTHGRSMLYRQALGSVSGEIVRAARFPVLVVPVRKDEE